MHDLKCLSVNIDGGETCVRRWRAVKSSAGRPNGRVAAAGPTRPDVRGEANVLLQFNDHGLGGPAVRLAKRLRTPPRGPPRSSRGGVRDTRKSYYHKTLCGRDGEKASVTGWERASETEPPAASRSWPCARCPCAAAGTRAIWVSESRARLR